MRACNGLLQSQVTCASWARRTTVFRSAVTTGSELVAVPMSVRSATNVPKRHSMAGGTIGTDAHGCRQGGCDCVCERPTRRRASAAIAERQCFPLDRRKVSLDKIESRPGNPFRARRVMTADEFGDVVQRLVIEAPRRWTLSMEERSPRCSVSRRDFVLVEDQELG